MRKPARRILRSIARLRSSLQVCRDHLGRRLAERHAQRGAYGPVFDHLDAELKTVESELADAENGLAADQLSAALLRQKRDRASLELRDRHRPIERFCRSQPGLRGAGIVDSTPECPYALEQQATQTVDFLRALEADAAAGRNPPALTAGVSVDTGALADDLEGGLPRLQAAITAVERAESDVRLARGRANQGFVEAERVLSWVARMLDGLSGLAGEERLAARIRRCCG